ncbi:MAG: hypothetical protein K2J80_09985 [Oscillospiraceae bacterium]|nr:hypothetical protein [Oscillospiraceae bacterium]
MDWWRQATGTPLGNENFWKIIDFYLFNCPVKTKSGKKFQKVSQRAKTFEDQKWIGGKLTTLWSAMKNRIAAWKKKPRKLKRVYILTIRILRC